MSMKAIAQTVLLVAGFGIFLESFVAFLSFLPIIAAGCLVWHFASKA